MENFKGPGQLAHLERVLSEHWGGQRVAATGKPAAQLGKPMLQYLTPPTGLMTCWHLPLAKPNRKPMAKAA